MFFAVRLERGGPWDWSRDLREQDGWDEHARFMDALAEDGFIVLGGPVGGERIADGHPETGEHEPDDVQQQPQGAFTRIGA